MKGKSHQLLFKQCSSNRASRPLELIHSVVCGKIGTASLDGGEYFITYVDDHMRHLWIYILKHKSEVYSILEVGKPW